MAETSQDSYTPPPPPPQGPPPGSAPGGPNPGQAVAESLGVITKPETTIPKIVDTPGFVLAGIIAGAYVIIATLMFILNWPDEGGPGIKFVAKEFVGQIVLVAVLAGLIYGLAVSLLGRPEVKLEHAANAVAAALVPTILVKILLYIVSLIWLRLWGWLQPLDAIVLPLFLMAALEKGLKCNLRAALYTTILAYLVAMILYTTISGGFTGAFAGAMADMNRQAMQAVNQMQGMMQGFPR